VSVPFHYTVLRCCFIGEQQLPNVQKPCIAGPLALPELVALGLEILEGLMQLHAVQILHLDLKPANILLDYYSHAYLSDFGISQVLSTLEACTAVTGMSGTPHYMYAHSLLGHQHRLDLYLL